MLMIAALIGTSISWNNLPGVSKYPYTLIPKTYQPVPLFVPKAEIPPEYRIEDSLVQILITDDYGKNCQKIKDLQYDLSNTMIPAFARSEEGS